MEGDENASSMNTVWGTYSVLLVCIRPVFQSFQFKNSPVCHIWFPRLLYFGQHHTRCMTRMLLCQETVDGDFG